MDIGGPSMLRSAAKNHEFVLPVVDPTDYAKVLELLRQGALTREVRREFAAKVFAHTSDYDAAIAGYLTAARGRLAPADRHRAWNGCRRSGTARTRASAPRST